MRVDQSTSPTNLISGLKENVSSNTSFRKETETNNNNKGDHTVNELTDKINKKLVESGTHIQVKLHEKTKTIMVLVVADETEEVIREIPKEKMLDIMYNMCVQVGVFLDEKM